MLVAVSKEDAISSWVKEPKSLNEGICGIALGLMDTGLGCWESILRSFLSRHEHGEITVALCGCIGNVVAQSRQQWRQVLKYVYRCPVVYIHAAQLRPRETQDHTGNRKVLQRSRSVLVTVQSDHQKVVETPRL